VQNEVMSVGRPIPAGVTRTFSGGGGPNWTSLDQEAWFAEREAERAFYERCAARLRAFRFRRLAAAWLRRAA